MRDFLRLRRFATAMAVVVALLTAAVVAPPVAIAQAQTIEMTVSEPAPSLSEVVTYFITVPCETADVVTVEVVLPADLEPTGRYITTNGAADLSGQVFTWTPTPNPAFQGTEFCPATAELDARVALSASGTIVTTATLDTLSASASIDVQAAELMADIAIDKAMVVQNGDVTYTLTVPCTLDLGEIVTTTTFPTGITPGSWGTNNGSGGIDGQLYNWGPTINPALSDANCPAVATIDGFIGPDALGTLTNTFAAASSDGAFSAEASADVLVVRRGDADCDGSISLLDARRVALIAIGALVGPDPCPTPNENTAIFNVAGDMEGDGLTSLADARNVALCAIGVPTTGCAIPPA